MVAVLYLADVEFSAQVGGDAAGDCRVIGFRSADLVALSLLAIVS